MNVIIEAKWLYLKLKLGITQDYKKNLQNLDLPKLLWRIYSLIENYTSQVAQVTKVEVAQVRPQ